MRKGFDKLHNASVALVLLSVLMAICTATVLYADDADVLPKGVFRALQSGQFYAPIDRRFDPDGNVEDVAADFNAALNSNVFPALAPLDPFVPGLPSIGDSIVSFKYDLQYMDIDLHYGLTDRVTVGVQIPYRWIKNRVKARVNSAPGSSANVGKNPCFGVAGCPFGAATPLVPTSLGGVRLSTEDVQGLLGPGLDINADGRVDIPGFGYKRFQTYSGNGLGNIGAGFRYQYLRTEDWRLALTSGVRFPTARLDDEDNLTDAAFGLGGYNIFFHFNNDYILSNLWTRHTPSEAIKTGELAPTGTLVVNGTFRYELRIPYKQTMRITSDPNNPISRNKERVDRDIGDGFEYEGSLKYTLFKGVSFSALYKFGFKLKDRVSGNKGFNYESQERETPATEHIAITGLTYSTVPLYLGKKFPVPMTISFNYRNRFLGSNNLQKAQYYNLVISVFF